MRKPKLICLYILFACLPAILVEVAHAQPKVRLVRTNKQGNPIKVQLYAGYNGMSTPDDKLQDMFENTYMTIIGGIMVGVKTMYVLDTIGLPVWAGINAYYHRTLKRSLSDAHGVHYPDSPQYVNGIETMSSYGLEGLVAFGPYWRVTIEAGGGAQFLSSVVDHQTAIIGLFQPVWLPTAMAGVNYCLLAYEHGSIDANLRFLKTFGEYRNFQFQSLFCFTFIF
jgi:hypothetical protein